MKRKILSLMALCGMSSFALACSDSSTPLGAEFDELPVVSFFDTAPGNNMDVLKRTTPLPNDVSITTTVTNAQGGTMNLSAAGMFVRIPPGSLGADVASVDVTLTALAGEDVAFEFGPHGLEFTQPISIYVSTNGTEAQGYTPTSVDQTTTGAASGYGGTNQALDSFLGVYYTGDAATGPVTPEQTFPVFFKWSWLVFQTDHFSGYAMAF